MKERLLASFPVRVGKRYAAAQGGTWATAIAWNALFAFFPIVLVAITVIGFVLQGTGITSQLTDQIMQAFPGGDGQTVVDALDSFRRNAGPLAIVSFVGLFWSGSALFSTVDQGLDALYPCKPRDFVRQKLMAFGMILLFSVLLLVAVASSSLLSIIGRLPVVPDLLAHGPTGLLLQFALGVVDGSLLFGAIYFVVPNRKHRIRTIIPGAVVAAALFEGFILLFPLYFRINHGFATYGKNFALFFLLMTFAFFLAQIIMLGGAVNAELDPPGPGAGRLGGGVEPAEVDCADPDAPSHPEQVHGEAAPDERSRVARGG